MERVKLKLQNLISKKRYIHSLQVAETAVKLAKKYNVDEEKAYLAGLLHDCGKAFSIEKMLDLVHVKKDREIFYVQPEILHGFAGAIYARNIFRIEDKEILNAIRYHTIGRRNMGMLEKIIYISDVIEPGRKCCNLDKIKEVVYEDIDKAILTEINNKIRHLVDKGRAIHPNSVDLRNSLILEKK